MPQQSEPKLQLPTQSAKGFAYRFVKLKYAHDPISGIGALKAGGRYHIKGGFRALYASEDPVAALKETEFLHRTEQDIVFKPASPMVLFALEYNLERVLDLRNPATLEALGATRSQLFEPWLRGTLENPSPTQRLARVAYEAGAQALFAPTVVPPHQAANVVIYPDNLTASGSSWVQVSNSDSGQPHRIP